MKKLIFKNLLFSFCTLPFTVVAQNVGIGTTNPIHKLHVNGGNLFVNSAAESKIIYGTETANQWNIFTSPLLTSADLRWGTTIDGGTTITPRHYFSQNGDVGLGGFSGIITPIASLDVFSKSINSFNSAFAIRNSSLDTILRVRDDERIGIGYNGTNYGRTLNIGGFGINFYVQNEGPFGGAIFPTDTSLVMWSNSNANNYVVIQPT